jgi:ATP-dependent Clp protease ATP-binding subunit ClpB
MVFRLDKLTVKAQEAVALRRPWPAERGNPELDSLHLLAALLDQSDGIVNPILDKIGANRAATAIHRRFGIVPVAARQRWFARNQPGDDAGAGEAQRESESMKDEFVSTEHLLLAWPKPTRRPRACWR